MDWISFVAITAIVFVLFSVGIPLYVFCLGRILAAGWTKELKDFLAQRGEKRRG